MSESNTELEQILNVAIGILISLAVSRRVEGNSTTYRLPNGATLVIPTGFANKEAKDD